MICVNTSVLIKCINIGITLLPCEIIAYFTCIWPIRMDSTYVWIILLLYDYYSYPCQFNKTEKLQLWITNITRLNIHLYGDSFISIKTHIEGTRKIIIFSLFTVLLVAHSIQRLQYQGKLGWLHCFTPERDNKTIKTINMNSTNVFYNLLQISGIITDLNF
jgi:hypothetical protein